MPIIPQLYPQIKKTGRKKGTWILFIILLIMAGMKFLIFDWVVPKTASFTIPQKWRMIPLRQIKAIVHNYLGDPLPQSSTNGNEEWANGSKGKMYFLKIYYVSDTIAAGYSIHYKYENWFSSRNYLIDSFSIR